MANQDLIDYENQIKAQNDARIEDLNKSIVSINQSIDQMNTTINEYQAQITDTESQIDALEAGNIKIDEIITILEAA